MSENTVILTKDELEQKEAAWDHVARSEGHRCYVCNSIPPYGERDVYFETGLCGWHAHMLNKDD